VNKRNQKKPSREEILAAINECAAKLGHPPTYPELKRETNLPRTVICKYFINYSKALIACGLEPEGPGSKVSLGKLFAEYVSVMHRIGKVPTQAEYELAGRFSRGPFLRRFGMWTYVAEAMLQYAEREKPEGQWDDVLDMLRRHCKTEAGKNRRFATPGRDTRRPMVLDDRPLYGEWLHLEGLVHAPVNEAGVLFLFGMVAARLGFVVTWIGTHFPDCEALRQAGPGRWQRVRIEFEFQSRSFLHHRHDPAQCDLIVCWEDNWPECPLEVLELREAVSDWQHSRSPESRAIGKAKPYRGFTRMSR
jgi:hypothetical protein